MPRKNGVAERVKQNRQAQQARGEAFSQAVEAALVLDGPRADSRNQVIASITDYYNGRKKLRTLWGLSTTGEHQQRFIAPYLAQLELTKNLRQTIDQQLVQLKQRTEVHSAAAQTAIDHLVPKKLGAVDDLSEEKQARSNLYETVLDNYREIEQFYTTLAEDSNQHVPSGRSMAEVVSEARTGSKSTYIELMDNFARVYRDLESVREAALASAAVLEKWTDDSSFGKTKAAHFLKQQERQPPAITALRMKLTSLTNLKELSLDRYARTSDPVESFYLQRLSSTNLIPVYNAHLDLRQYTGYSLSERKATLETVIGTYQRVLSDSLAIQDTNPGLQRAEYQQLFAERLRDVINDAQTDLAEVMREEQALVPAAVVRIDQRQKPAGQRTFKTRDKETLIGTARPQAAGSGVIIDVLDPQSGRSVASYSEHASEGEWVKIVPAQPARPASSPKSLSTLKSDARKLLEESAGIERTIAFQKRKLNDPQRRGGHQPAGLERHAASPGRAASGDRLAGRNPSRQQSRNRTMGQTVAHGGGRTACQGPPTLRRWLQGPTPQTGKHRLPVEARVRRHQPGSARHRDQKAAMSSPSTPCVKKARSTSCGMPISTTRPKVRRAISTRRRT